MIASLRPDFAAPDTSSVHGSAALNMASAADVAMALLDGFDAVPDVDAVVASLPPPAQPIHVAAITHSTENIDFMRAQHPS